MLHRRTTIASAAKKDWHSRRWPAYSPAPEEAQAGCVPAGAAGARGPARPAGSLGKKVAGTCRGVDLDAAGSALVAVVHGSSHSSACTDGRCGVACRCSCVGVMEEEEGSRSCKAVAGPYKGEREPGAEEVGRQRWTLVVVAGGLAVPAVGALLRSGGEEVVRRSFPDEDNPPVPHGVHMGCAVAVTGIGVGHEEASRHKDDVAVVGHRRDVVTWVGHRGVPGYSVHMGEEQTSLEVHVLEIS